MSRWISRLARDGLIAVLVMLLATVMVVPLVGAWTTCGFRGCPDVTRLNAYQPEGASILLDRNGVPFADLNPGNVEVIPLQKLPPYVAQAFVAVEDKRFFRHKGVDWLRVGGAVRADLGAGGFEEGFSTITMQLARTVFAEQIPRERRTVGRKLLEIRVAREIERHFSKAEILELYLNRLYFGHGAHGIQAASRYYFGRPAERLTLAQAALLAGLPKAPSHYDPRSRPQAAMTRRNLVIGLMQEQGRISERDAQRAESSRLGAAKEPRPASGTARYFTEQVRQELEQRFGERLYDQPLRIWTTLDLKMQRSAERELEKQLRAVESGSYGALRAARYGSAGAAGRDGTSYLQGAFVALDVHSGDVLAWVGGRNFDDSQFDRVLRSRRQAGSAFKPFVYATALSDGLSLSQPLSDEPLSVVLADGRVWEPKNFGDRYRGQVSMRDALVYSRNTATVRLAQQVGYGSIADFARRAGIASPISQHPSMPLGTVSVSPLELASAYTTFAGMGNRALPRTLLRMEDRLGRVLWESNAQAEQVLDPGTAYLVNDVLRDVVDRGTATAVRSAGFGYVAAGKTGTSNEGTDAWFVGYTPEVLAAVWIGFDELRPITESAAGGVLAAPVWGRVMSDWYNGRPRPEGWQRPGNVVQAQVDSSSGRVLSADCSSAGSRRSELFLMAFEPAPTCPEPPPLVAEGEGIAGRAGVPGEEAAPAPGVAEPGQQPPSESPGAGTGQVPGAFGASPGSEVPRALPPPTSTPDTPPPPGPDRGAGPRSHDLTGYWEVRNRIEQSNYPQYRGLSLAYRISLTQNGRRLSGVGHKSAENRRAVPPAQQTEIRLRGYIADGYAYVSFTEYGTRRTTGGSFRWRVSDDGLSGAFSSSAAGTRGSSAGRRL